MSEWLDAWRGGAETSTLQLIAHLREAGIELDIFTRSRPSPEPGMRVHTVSGAAKTRTRASITFANRVDRRIRAEKFDVVHAISGCLTADIYQPRGGTVAESVERNLAAVRNGTARRLKRLANYLNFKRRYQLATERKLFAPRERPIVVAISDYVVRQLKRHYALPDERIRKIYNAVEPDPADMEERRRDRQTIRREYRVADNELLVILVAHNYRLKGVDRWMEALAHLVHRRSLPVRSLVIGRAPVQRWRQRVRRLGISAHLTFTGPTHRVWAFLHAADVLVHPTFYDPCSRVVLEALAAGLPCVTTCWDGAAERIEDGLNGFVVQNPADTEALCDRIMVLSRAERRAAMGRMATEAATRVTAADHARAVISLYEEVAASRRPAGV